MDSFKAGNEKFLDPTEVDKVQKAVLEEQEWLNKMCADRERLKMTSDPPVPVAQIKTISRKSIDCLRETLGYPH